ncbi:acyl-CoA dehydrogenase family protein [Castellaniella sp.]|uniref:acyl-CoA dehydrogenase family protein n=1 Tax=Castellaniella sp. TaxID=1955812 RepID=UPI00355E48FD
MDLTYRDEQRMLLDSLDRLLASEWALDSRRARARDPSLDRAAWQGLADLGVLALLVPEAHGGFQETPATLMLAQITLGRHLVQGPLIPSAVMATALLRDSGHAAVCQSCLPAMASGERVLAVAWLEGDQRHEVVARAVTARPDAQGWEISGTKKLVWAGAQADQIIVSAALGDEQALFLVPAGARGVAVQDYPTLDGQHCATLVLDRVGLPAGALVARGAAARKALESALDHGLVALCAHAAGATQRLVEITTGYLEVREQFGRSLARFQVLQHALADMLMHQEMALSLAHVAARGLGDTDPSERRRLLSAAKVGISAAARFVAEQAVQLHGGMGMTDELEASDYVRSLAMFEFLLGDSDWHLSRFQDHAVC